jgi:hypothetical protein
MKPFRRLAVAALALGAALSMGVTAASASTLPMPHFTFPTTGYTFPAGAFSFPATATAAVAVAAIGANASSGGDVCGSSSAQQGGNGPVAGATAQTCLGAGGLSFVGPAIGQISSIIGPTIIGPSVGVTVIQSAGNVGGG